MYLKKLWVKGSHVHLFMEELKRQSEFVKVLKLPYMVDHDKMPQDLQKVAGAVFCAEITISEEHPSKMVKREVIDKLLDATGFYWVDSSHDTSCSFDIGSDIAEKLGNYFMSDEEEVKRVRQILHPGALPSIASSSYFEIESLGKKKVLEKDGFPEYRKKAVDIIAHLLAKMLATPAIPDLSPFTDLVGASDPHIESTSKWEKLCEMIPGLECLSAELRELGDRPEARSGGYTPLEYQSTVRKIFRLLIKVIVDNANAKTAEA